MEGTYLYCVIEAKGLPQSFGPWGIGGRGDELFAVPWNDLACVVSHSPLDEYVVSREYTLAHHQAIQEVYKRFPVLPVCFNTVTESEQGIVEKLLKPRHDELMKLLRWVEDKEEVGLKVHWQAIEPVLAVIGRENQGIRALKEAAAQEPLHTRYYRQIEAGKMVESALKAEQIKTRDHVLGRLKGLAEEVRLDPVYGDRRILNAAFFVQKSKILEFEMQKQALARESDANLVFSDIPAGPPFHFVELRINLKEESHASRR